MRYKEELINQEYDESEYEIDFKTLIIHVNGELDHHNAVAIRKMADKKYMIMVSETFYLILIKQNLWIALV